MANPATAVLGAILAAGATFAENNEAAVVADLKAANVRVADAAIALVDSTIDAAAGHNPLFVAFKGTLKSAAANAEGALIAAAGSEEAALYGLGVAWLKSEAARLSA